MCVNCVTSVDTLAANAVGIAAAIAAIRDRAFDFRIGRSRAERKQLCWERNAAFLASIGHTPEHVLGASPLVPTDDSPELVSASHD
ncbi:MAG: hypothetical protein ACKVHU_19750 [Acidimicrobiales bacterium]|jgi:hypothetical protein